MGTPVPDGTRPCDVASVRTLSLIVALAAALAGPAVARAQALPMAGPQPNFYPPPSAYPGPAFAPPSFSHVWPQTLEEMDHELARVKFEVREAKRRGDAHAERLWEERRESLRRARRELFERTTERASSGMMVTGIVLTPLGGSALIAGIAFMSIGAFDDATPEAETFERAGLIASVAGVAVLGAGLSLWIVGARRVPREAAIVINPRELALRAVF